MCSCMVVYKWHQLALGGGLSNNVSKCVKVSTSILARSGSNTCTLLCFPCAIYPIHRQHSLILSAESNHRIRARGAKETLDVDGKKVPERTDNAHKVRTNKRGGPYGVEVEVPLPYSVFRRASGQPPSYCTAASGPLLAPLLAYISYFYVHDVHRLRFGSNYGVLVPYLSPCDDHAFRGRSDKGSSY